MDNDENKKTQQSVGSEIYEGSASFGRFWAKFSFVIAVIIGIVLIISGIYILVHKSNKIKTTGIIIDELPNPCQYISDSKKYQCNVKVKYTVNGTTYTPTLWYSNRTFKSVGSNIDIYYRKNDPSNASLDGPTPKWVGIASIIIGILIPLFAYFIVYLTNRSKFAASAVGIGGAYDLLRAV